MLELFFPYSFSRAAWHCRDSTRLEPSYHALLTLTEIQSTDSSGRALTHRKDISFKPTYLNVQVFIVKIPIREKKRKKKIEATKLLLHNCFSFPPKLTAAKVRKRMVAQ